MRRSGLAMSALGRDVPRQRRDSRARQWRKPAGTLNVSYRIVACRWASARCFFRAARGQLGSKLALSPDIHFVDVIALASAEGSADAGDEAANEK